LSALIHYQDRARSLHKWKSSYSDLSDNVFICLCRLSDARVRAPRREIDAETPAGTGNQINWLGGKPIDREAVVQPYPSRRYAVDRTIRRAPFFFLGERD